jgi:hypothetical protein
MITPSKENDWAVWMRAAMTGDSGAYRQLLVSLVPHVRAVCGALPVSEVGRP